jgi:hypothetical protein
MRNALRRVLRHTMVVALLLGAAAEGSAAPILFSGSDPGVGPGGARPNSNAAAASFDAAAGLLGSASLINFEGLAVGNFASLLVAPGVTVTLSGTVGDTNAGITNVGDTTALGYNTTTGGSQHLRFVPDFNILTTTATFAFAQPIRAFGAFFTGVGTAAGAVQLIFDDGSLQTLTVPGSPTGGVGFFGFTDAGASIASVVVTETRSSDARDVFGIDDVRAVSAVSAVPEPASLTLVGIGLAALARRRYRRR